MSRWVCEEKLLEEMADVRDSEQILRELADAGLIESSPAPAESGDATTWSRWGMAARAFHAATSTVEYVDRGSDQDVLVDRIVADPGPPLVERVEGDVRIALPAVPLALNRPLDDVLGRRRTHRHFRSEPMSLAELATLLHYTFRPLGTKRAGPFGNVPIKASPCAGARNEVESYVAAFAVRDVPPAVYRYDQTSHELVLIDDSWSRETVREWAFDHIALETCAVMCITTAVLERVSWKYRHPRAYRLLFYNVGHLAQTFALVSTAIGLGAYQSAAFHDIRLGAALGLDPDREIPTYLLAAGAPRTRSGGLPWYFEPGGADAGPS